MSGIITTGSHPKGLWPGVFKWFGLAYDEYPVQYTALFDEETSNKKYEEIVESVGFGLAVVKDEADSVSYDTAQQGYTSRFTNVTYGLGYMVSREEKEDNLYLELGRRRAGRLAFSMRQTKEKVHANIYNRAFNNSYLGGDGIELCATNHGSYVGSQQNELTAAADLSEAAIEDMLTLVRKCADKRGLNASISGKSLIVPPEEEWNAYRILNSVLQSDTVSNNVNALKAMGMLPDGIKVNNHLTDTDAWFIRTTAQDGMITFQRRALEFTQDNDFDTENAKAKATERYVPGWADWRGLFGSPGA